MDLILLSSGIGERCGLSYPKQFYKIKNKTILSHVIDKFKNINKIDNIIVTYIPNNKELFADEIKKYPNILFIKGGQTRQESVYNALKYVKSKRVIIHESVRPFVNEQYIEKLIDIKHDCIVPYKSIKSTIFYNEIQEYVDRNNLYDIQLPQIFNTSKLKQAHQLALNNNNEYTDDSSLYHKELDEGIIFVQGLEENIKITTKFDLKLLKILGDDDCE